MPILKNISKTRIYDFSHFCFKALANEDTLIVAGKKSETLSCVRDIVGRAGKQGNIFPQKCVRNVCVLVCDHFYDELWQLHSCMANISLEPFTVKPLYKDTINVTQILHTKHRNEQLFRLLSFTGLFFKLSSEISVSIQFYA